MSKEREIQEIVFDYFEDVSNTLLASFIESFMFEIAPDDSRVSKLAEKFLADNGLEEAFITYHKELTKPSQILPPTAPSQIDIMNHVRTALLVLVFNRFRRITDFDAERVHKYGRMQHFLGTEDKEFVLFDDWKDE